MERDVMQRLRNTAGMLRMGEKIAFGSDADLMDEAADEIERLKQELYSAWDEISVIRSKSDPKPLPPLGPNDVAF